MLGKIMIGLGLTELIVIGVVALLLIGAVVLIVSLSGGSGRGKDE